MGISSVDNSDLFKGAPNLKSAFQASAGDPTPPAQDLRRELTVQNRLLQSYTNTTVEEWHKPYEGLSLEERRTLVEQGIDQQMQEQDGYEYDNVQPDIAGAIERAQLQVGLLSNLDLSNDRANDVRAGYNYVWNHARPVTSLEAADQNSYDSQFMDEMERGYSKDDHSLRAGEITYDLNDGAETMSAQFKTQFEAIDNPSHAYTKNPIFGDPEFAVVKDLSDEAANAGVSRVDWENTREHSGDRAQTAEFTSALANLKGNAVPVSEIEPMGIAPPDVEISAPPIDVSAPKM